MLLGPDGPRRQLTSPLFPFQFLCHVKSVRDQSCIPCEEMSVDFKILPSSCGHARDAYAFGAMVENLLTALNDQAFSKPCTVRC